MDCILSNLVISTEVGGIFETLDVCDTIQRDLDRLEKCANAKVNFMSFTCGETIPCISTGMG